MRDEYKPGQYRDELMFGLTVDIVLKQDQKTGKLTRGKIQDILTNKSYHPRGVKVRLQGNEDGLEPDRNFVGRVQDIIGYGDNVQ